MRVPDNDNENPEFVGRVGRFCPIKPGCGGSELLRESKDKDGNIKYGAAVGTKGYHWLESEMVKAFGKENDIDRSYYDKLVDDAVATISKYGDFEWFVSDDPYIGSKKDDEGLPWLMPCGDAKYMTCFECPHFRDNGEETCCGLDYDISHTIMLTKPNNK